MSEEPSAQAPTVSRKRERAIYWALLLVPLALMIAGIATTRTPARAGLSEAARLLRERYREGDLILVVGVSRDDAGFLLGGLPFVVVEPGAELPTDGFNWIWVLDGNGGRGVALPSLGVPLQTEDLRSASLALHRPPSPLMGGLLGAAHVSFLRKGAAAPEACPRSGPDTYRCPLHSWLQVTPAVVQVRGRNLRCVHAHPAPEGTLRIELPDVTLGPKLRLETALADTAQGVSPVTVRLSAGGKPLGTFVHALAPGSEAHDFETGLAGQKASVTLELDVPSPGRHHFCFVLTP